jgi:hypothetical protein
VLIVVLAAPYPSAAGMMLVFPTLNGLGFVFSPRDRVLGMVPSMLWLPVINGLLCAAYLLAFLALATRVSSLVSLALILLAAVSAAFVVLVRLRFVRAGVPAAAQLTFANVATLVSLGFAAAALLLGSDHATSVLSAAAAHTSALHDVQEILVRNAPKIALFTLCLAAFLIATRLLPLSDSARGILAGLPVAPFGGLVSVATDGSIDFATRVEIFRHMATSIWLGPPIAIWFIYAFPRVLMRSTWEKAGSLYLLVAAWALCALAIIAATSVLPG